MHHKVLVVEDGGQGQMVHHPVCRLENHRPQKARIVGATGIGIFPQNFLSK